MSYPVSYFISSSVTHVDTTTASKIVMLPTASTILNIPLFIRDMSGNAVTNNIVVSTQTFDLIDHYASTITMASNYQSIRLIPFSTTRYALTLNFLGDISPYLG